MIRLVFHFFFFIMKERAKMGRGGSGAGPRCFAILKILGTGDSEEMEFHECEEIVDIQWDFTDDLELFIFYFCWKTLWFLSRDRAGSN